MKNLISNISRLAIAFALLPALAACNDTIEDPLALREYPAPDNVKAQAAGSSKVIWIVAEGVSGSAMRQAVNAGKAPATKSRLDNSIYTFNGLADSRTSMTVTGDQGWANLLNGKLSEDSRDVFSLMDASSKTCDVFTANSYLAQRAGEHVRLNGSDVELVEAVKTKLGSGEAIPDLTILTLSDFDREGDKDTYYDESGLYASDETVAHISLYDSYFNEILKAIETRPSYNKENWLVVFTSNYGGIESNEGQSAYDMKDRNTFTLLWNKNFNPTLMQRPIGTQGLEYSFFSLGYTGKNKTFTESAVLNSPELFNFKYDGSVEDRSEVKSYTIQFAIWVKRNSQTGQTSHNTVLSKCPKRQPGKNEGWEIRLQKQHFVCLFAGSDKINTKTELTNDGDWHVLTTVLDYQNQRCYMYVDGKPDLNQTAKGETYYDLTTISKWKPADWKHDNSKDPLTIGKNKNAKTVDAEFIISNLQIYDVALPADYIRSNYNLVQLDKRKDEIPYWDNLIGYWPMDREEDAGSNVLKDYSKYGSVENGVNAGLSDFTVPGEMLWEQGTASSANLRPQPEMAYFQQVINNIDVPMMSFQWMNILIDMDWNWTGICRSWPYNYK